MNRIIRMLEQIGALLKYELIRRPLISFFLRIGMHYIFSAHENSERILGYSEMVYVKLYLGTGLSAIGQLLSKASMIVL